VQAQRFAEHPFKILLGREASPTPRRARARQDSALDCPSDPRRQTDGSLVLKKLSRQPRPSFDKKIIRAKGESRSSFLREDEAIL
jgi:hypothetical protein